MTWVGCVFGLVAVAVTVLLAVLVVRTEARCTAVRTVVICQTEGTR